LRRSAIPNVRIRVTVRVSGSLEWRTTIPYVPHYHGASVHSISPTPQQPTRTLSLGDKRHRLAGCFPFHPTSFRRLAGAAEHQSTASLVPTTENAERGTNWYTGRGGKQEQRLEVRRCFQQVVPSATQEGNYWSQRKKLEAKNVLPNINRTQAADRAENAVFFVPGDHDL